MLIKYSLLFIIFFSSIYSSKAQFCDTQSPSVLPNYGIPTFEKSSINDICIDVQFHVLRNSTGNSAVENWQVDIAFNNLNAAFSQHQIYFNNLGINYITDNDFYDLNEVSGDAAYGEFNNLVQMDRNSSALNIYFVNDFEGSGGRADGIPSNASVIPQNGILSSTIVHEVGHNFGIIHTHETAYGDENIERFPNLNANCNTKGTPFAIHLLILI